MRAKLAKSRALLVLAEAEIPAALAMAFRKGQLHARRRRRGTGTGNNSEPRKCDEITRNRHPCGDTLAVDSTRLIDRHGDYSSAIANCNDGLRNEVLGADEKGLSIVSMTTVDASTPNYVLIHGALRIGPKLVPSGTQLECSAIYGFSDKGPYDKFLRE